MGTTDPALRIAEYFGRREAELRREIDEAVRAYAARPSVRLALLFDKCVLQLQHRIREAVGYFGGRR